MIVPTTARHVDALEAAGLRAADRRFGNLRLSVERSTRLWTVLSYPARPVAIFGVGPWASDPGLGYPWILVTEGHDADSALLSNTKHYVNEMGRDFIALSSYVHATDRAAVRWLEREGFSFIDSFTLGDEPYFQTLKETCHG